MSNAKTLRNAKRCANPLATAPHGGAGNLLANANSGAVARAVKNAVLLMVARTAYGSIAGNQVRMKIIDGTLGKFVLFSRMLADERFKILLLSRNNLRVFRYD